MVVSDLDGAIGVYRPKYVAGPSTNWQFIYFALLSVFSVSSVVLVLCSYNYFVKECCAPFAS